MVDQEATAGKPATVAVSEIFTSIQGEGPRIGQPTLFIRLYGCDQRCSWCDTMYAVKGGVYTSYTVDQLIAAIRKYPARPWRSVTFTGGEPALQIRAIEAVRNSFLFDSELWRSWNIEISHRLDRLAGREHVFDSVVWSPKPPSSGNPYFLTDPDIRVLKVLHNTYRTLAVKFVVGSPEDYEFSKNLYSDLFQKGIPEPPLFFQPEEKTPLAQLFDWWKAAPLLPIGPVRILPQTHKLVGMP